jgi:ssDNA-binding Zn-finger/Zn-ribbon topoisomerase 1
MKPHHPLGFGFLVFLVSYIALLILIGPTTCNDGLHSPSIGKQGACSWHGGVNVFPQLFSFWFSVFLGWLTYKWGTRRFEREQQAIKDARETDETLCPLCGSPVVVRIAKRGSRKGNVFLGCTRFPVCRGTRDLKS